MLVVSDILRQKGSAVVTVEPSLRVDEFVAILSKERIGAAVVSSDGTTVEGIISERDVVRALASHGVAALAMAVTDICTDEVVLAGPHDKLDELMTTMTERRFRHLPVVIDGALSGIISIGDVVKARVGELELEQQALTTYITTGR